MKATDFKLRYLGETHQIDANVFINSLLHTTTLIKEANKELDDSRNIEIKIDAIEPGSFVVNLIIEEAPQIIETVKNIFSPENVAYGSALVSTVVGSIQLSKFLKGNKPEVLSSKGDEITIKNKGGDTIIIKDNVFNLYTNNPVARESISQNFETLKDDPSIEGIEFSGKSLDNNYIVEKEDFNDLTVLSEIIEDNEKVILETAKLHILRLSFDLSLKWEFYYHGSKISGKVKDKSFQKRIDNGEHFAKGDVLVVELEILKKFDTTVDTWVNKKYTVVSILEHIPRGEQTKLDL